MPDPIRQLRLLLPAFLLLVASALTILTTAGPAEASAKRSSFPPAIEQSVSIKSDGIYRGYLVIRPAGPTTGLPLIVFLHGVSTTPGEELKRDGLLPLAAEGKAVLVYPAGYHGSWNTTDDCCQDAYAAHIDDLSFIHLVVVDVQAELSTNPSRTYLAGFSNGAKMVWTMACLAPMGFRAYAEFGGNPDPCPKRVKAPFFLGSGGLDGSEPILGKPADDRGPHPALKAGLDSMLTRNGCHGAGTKTAVSTAMITSWTDCAHAPVTSVDWESSAHVWPAAPVTSAAGSAATLMWNFFNAQR